MKLQIMNKIKYLLMKGIFLSYRMDRLSFGLFSNKNETMFNVFLHRAPAVIYFTENYNLASLTATSEEKFCKHISDYRSP